MKETKEVDGKDMLFTTSDRHFVIVRPKAFVHSSGTTWASEKVRLWQEEPDTFEVAEGSLPISSRVRSYAAKVRDIVGLYKDMSVEKDYERVTSNPSCPYSAYEIERLEHVLQNLSDSTTYKAFAGMFQKFFKDVTSSLCSNMLKFNMVYTSEADSPATYEIVHQIHENVIKLKDEAMKLREKLENGEERGDSFDKIMQNCSRVITTIDSFNFPKV